MFIFFYFIYPNIASFLYDFLGEDSYLFILLYNTILAYIFLVFSGYHKQFLKNIRKINLKISGIVTLVGLTFGVLFYLVKEPVPIQILFNPHSSYYFLKTIGFTLVLALSEQIIFSGFLYNVYKNLTTKKQAIYQVSIIFVLFHLLRFENLVKAYIENFEATFLLLILVYYILLFIFMITAIYFYDFKGKKYSGNFLYPVMLHFITDFTLFILIKIFGGY